ncbi:MAG: hypothetical protein QW255_05660 [Candidatus Bilamarchaeaceae archaeon]
MTDFTICETSKGKIRMYSTVHMGSKAYKNLKYMQWLKTTEERRKISAINKRKIQDISRLLEIWRIKIGKRLVNLYPSAPNDKGKHTDKYKMQRQNKYRYFFKSPFSISAELNSAFLVRAKLRK